MKRRNFIKSVGALGVTAAAPSFFTNQSFIKKASAAASLNDANIIVPNQLPQVINIFLYGGPSELAGNLSNIADINANSQNPYDADRNAGGAGAEILELDDGNQAGQITAHGFWKDAGGSAMEDMITGNGFGGAGNEMLSVYRTINRRKDNTRAHRPSILSGQKGNLDIEMSGGVGTTIASVMVANRAAYENSTALNGRSLEDLILPFVSFEGKTSAFAPDSSSNSISIPLTMKGISLDTNFNNPYTRGNGVANSKVRHSAIDTLVNKISSATQNRFSEVSDGFKNRAYLESKIANFSSGIDGDNASRFMPNVGIGDPDADENGILVYPNNKFARRVRAAVTLALLNEDSLYITVGGGLGGWDDHDNAISKYEDRMTGTMAALRVAAKHIKFGTRFAFSDNDNNPDTDEVAVPLVGVPTDNIVINVFGDFGRNVNLNGSMGWDHGNNQNLYTIGGAGLEGRGQSGLGKVVGKTELFGTSGQNRQFTRPTSDSYEAEPMSIAATVYSYFGVQNPEVLTSDAEMNPAGDPKIDETVAGEPVLF